MTSRQLTKLVAKRTGLPEPLVHQVLAAERDTICFALIQRQTVVLKGLLSIVPKDTNRSVSADKNFRTGAKKVVKRIILSVRPSKLLRAELNRWSPDKPQ